MGQIMRKIEIDMGHRIPSHHSKCKNVHGHRYVIEATYEGPKIEEGPEEGMLIDFGFIKEDMMMYIHDLFDHNFCFYVLDHQVVSVYGFEMELNPEETERILSHAGNYKLVMSPLGMCVAISRVPTAENLAICWHALMELALSVRQAESPRYRDLNLVGLKVWETPNSYATF